MTENEMGKIELEFHKFRKELMMHGSSELPMVMKIKLCELSASARKYLLFYFE